MDPENNITQYRRNQSRVRIPSFRNAELHLTPPCMEFGGGKERTPRAEKERVLELDRTGLFPNWMVCFISVEKRKRTEVFKNADVNRMVLA